MSLKKLLYLPGVTVVETGMLSMSSLTVNTLTLYSTPGLKFSNVHEFCPAFTNSSTEFPCCPLVGVQVTLYPVMSAGTEQVLPSEDQAVHLHSEHMSSFERVLDMLSLHSVPAFFFFFISMTFQAVCNYWNTVEIEYFPTV